MGLNTRGSSTITAFMAKENIPQTKTLSILVNFATITKKALGSKCNSRGRKTQFGATTPSLKNQNIGDLSSRATVKGKESKKPRSSFTMAIGRKESSVDKDKLDIRTETTIKASGPMVSLTVRGSTFRAATQPIREVLWMANTKETVAWNTKMAISMKANIR